MSRYANVDWTKRDVDIAQELGVTRACIGLARQRMKNGKLDSKKGRPAKVAKKLAVWTKWQMRDAHIASAIGCSSTAVAAFRAAHDIPKGTAKNRIGPGKTAGRPPKSKWIKCADRLPKDRVKVWVWGVSDHLALNPDYVHLPEMFTAKWSGRNRFIAESNRWITGTHWMPLPSPPQD